MVGGAVAELLPFIFPLVLHLPPEVFRGCHFSFPAPTPEYDTMPIRNFLLVAIFLPALLLGACGASQRSFDSPDAAVAALRAAVADDERGELRALFGPRSDELRSGDPEQDRSDFVAFSYKLTEQTLLLDAPVSHQGPPSQIILVGVEEWPFPVPLVSDNRGRWRFDTDAGVEQLTDRRIGENELSTIDALRAFVLAEQIYQSEPRTTDGVRAYTARMLSTPGERDGLFWETAENEEPSPIGPVMAMAVAQSSVVASYRPEPYYGYLFKTLTRQGRSAPGGEMDYFENGRLTRGIAAVAFPAEHGRTGIMTFIVSMEGTIYQRDLGTETAAIVAAMESFDPGEGWTPVTD